MKMIPSYVLWAVPGMACCSLMTLFVKFVERARTASTHMILAVSTKIVALVAIAIVMMRGEFRALVYDLEPPSLLWAIAAGIMLAIAVGSLFHALSLGSANVVVPIYGMFIVGGALLAVVSLDQPMTWHKTVGLIAAVAGVFLISL